MFFWVIFWFGFVFGVYDEKPFNFLRTFGSRVFLRFCLPEHLGWYKHDGIPIGVWTCGPHLAVGHILSERWTRTELAKAILISGTHFKMRRFAALLFLYKKI